MAATATLRKVKKLNALIATSETLAVKIETSKSVLLRRGSSFAVVMAVISK